MTSVMERPAAVGVGSRSGRQVIVEMGSGNTCRNDIMLVADMIDAVEACDSGQHEVVMKWQLFKSAPPNVPLDRKVFEFAYTQGVSRGYKVTASVFSRDDLDFLLEFHVPFVKIACRPHLYDLVWCNARPAYVSTSSEDGCFTPLDDVVCLKCVPEYPATLEQYEERFAELDAVSDHTVGWDLWHKHQPQIIEKHFVLERDPENPDAGPFAVTPEQLEEIL